MKEANEPYYTESGRRRINPEGLNTVMVSSGTAVNNDEIPTVGDVKNLIRDSNWNKVDLLPFILAQESSDNFTADIYELKDNEVIDGIFLHLKKGDTAGQTDENTIIYAFLGYKESVKIVTFILFLGDSDPSEQVAYLDTTTYASFPVITYQSIYPEPEFPTKLRVSFEALKAGLWSDFISNSLFSCYLFYKIGKIPA